MGCLGKTEGQDVQIGDRTRVVPMERLDHRELGGGEVPVDVEVRLHERNRGVNHSLRLGRA